MPAESLPGRPGPKAGLSRFDRALQWYFGAVFALSFTQADRLFSKEGLLPVSPSLFFLGLMLPLVGWAVLRDLRGPRRGGRLLELAGRNLSLVVPFAVLAALSLLWSLHPTANWGGNGRYVLMVPFDFAIFLLCLIAALLTPIREGLRHFALAAWLILVGTVLIDMVAPGLFSDQASRAAGVAEDANVSAFLMLSACALILTYGRSLRLDGVYLVVTSTAVLLTFSRGGLVLLVLLLFAYTVQFEAPEGGLRRAQRWVPAVAAVVVVVAGLVIVGRMAAAGSEAFARPTTRERIGMLTGEVEFLSDDDHRVQVLRAYVERVAAEPLVGYGTGHSYTFEVGPHNRYLQEWINLGLGGLLSYLALLGFALLTFRLRRSPAGTTYVFLLVFWSLLSQGVLEQRSVPISLGLLAAATLPAVARRLEGSEGG